MIASATCAFRSRPVAEWPSAMRAAWTNAKSTGDLLEPTGKASEWRPQSRLKTERGFGVWLDWVFRQGASTSATLVELISAERVSDYAKQLRESRAGYTVSCRLQELYDAARVMDLVTDWGWLRRYMTVARHRAEPVRDKSTRLRPAAMLEKLGLRLMQEATDSGNLSDIRRAVKFRDGLMIALLVRRPLRIANFARLTLDTDLFHSGGLWHLSIDAHKMKSRRLFEAPMPRSLSCALDRYLACHRPVLLNSSRTGLPVDALWVSEVGTPLAARSLHSRIRKHTAEEFSQPIPPHWFRDAATTVIVLESPREALTTMHILGHSTPTIAEQHYNRASSIDSSRRHVSLMTRLSEEAECSDGVSVEA